MGKKHYGAIDGLRTIAALGIVMMHIQANTSYKISGYLYERMIPEFTNFVFLFMVISAFGMCCGYYEKVLNNEIFISEFYKRRFLNAYTLDMDFHGGSKLSKLTYPVKTIYSVEARRKLRLVLEDFQPDVFHINNVE